MKRGPSASGVPPVFTQGALFPVPQSQGKTQFRLFRHAGQPFVFFRDTGGFRDWHTYRIADDQGDAYILVLVQASPALDEGTAPQTYVLTGKDMTDLRETLKKEQRLT
jgi:hypothetical protein